MRKVLLLVGIAATCFSLEILSQPAGPTEDAAAVVEAATRTMRTAIL